MSLKEEFRNPEYRRAYAESFANTVIATQLRLLRGSMTQAEFAELVGIKQSRVSAMEDENYSNWSTKSLKRLAAAKGVVFLGRFVSFGELLDWSRRMSEESLRVPAFEDDPAFLADRGDADRADDTVGPVLVASTNTDKVSLKLVKGASIGNASARTTADVVTSGSGSDDYCFEESAGTLRKAAYL